MFETLIVQPIFNLLALIYAVLPGHDFGLAVIVFTIVIRILLWPLLKKQLHQSKVMRELQPEIKKIRARTKGDKQTEAQLLMELYKERGVSPFGSIGLLFVQIPILIGLFQGLRRVGDNKDTILDLTYGWVQDMGWLKEVQADLSKFDETLFGLVDLTRSGFGEIGAYWPVIALAALAGILQYFQSSQLMPTPKDARGLREILRSEATGQKADQAEINAAVGRGARYLFPVITFVFAASVPGALALYWATGSGVGLIQQQSVLKTDVEEMEEQADKAVKKKTANKSSKNKKRSKGGKKGKK
jgi:YidC/Oxa1 family membrane protein insertase